MPAVFFFFTREKKNSSRENFQFYTREKSILPVKKSLKPPVKKNVYPWKILQNYTREKKIIPVQNNGKIKPVKNKPKVVKKTSFHTYNRWYAHLNSIYDNLITRQLYAVA